MTKLSIIITLYKSEAYIRKCLDSIYAQDIQQADYEVVVVDDGSPDNSADIVETYNKKYGNIKLIRQQNKGLAEARNVGIRSASGKYIRFVDPDDYIEPTGSAALLQKMEEEELDMLRFNYTMVDEKYQPLPDPKSKKYTDYRDEVTDGKTFLGKRLGFACYVWAFIFRSSLINYNNIYFIPASYFDDVHWLPRVLVKSQRVSSVSVRQSFYLQRSGSLVKIDDVLSLQRAIEGQFSIIEMFVANIVNKPDSHTNRWFQSMLAHSVISMLSIVSNHFYNSRSEYIGRLKSIGVFPLKIYKSKPINYLHVFLINLSPLRYCQIMFLRSK